MAERGVAEEAWRDGKVCAARLQYGGGVPAMEENSREKVAEGGTERPGSEADGSETLDEVRGWRPADLLGWRDAGLL